MELESAFVHLMNAEALKNPTENLEKARGHIYRSTLDCYKLIWLKISDEINEVAYHRSAYRGDEASLLQGLKDYDYLLRRARRLEMDSVGDSTLNGSVIDAWSDAVRRGMEIHERIDLARLNRLCKFQPLKGTRFWIASLIMGIIVSIIGNIIWSLI